MTQIKPPVRQATDALNLLESQGYAEFDNFRPDGAQFVADASLGGKPVRLLVDPDSRQIWVLDR